MFGNDTRLAQQAVTAAKRRGLPVSPDIEAAAAMYAVIVTAGHEPHPERPTADDIPATPEQLRQTIEDRAAAKRHADSIRAVAADFHEPLAARFNGLVKAAVPGWIQSLQPEFDGLVKALRTQARKLPDDLRVHSLDWNNPKISAAWEKAESAAHQLDQLVHDRQDMARAIGTDGGRDNELYAVAAFPTPTVEGVLAHRMRDEYGPLIREWKGLHGQPVSRWLCLVRADCLTLLLATPGEVTERAMAMQRWRDGIAAHHQSHTRRDAEAAVQQAIAA
ncbi:hypothetical protein ACIBL5_00490 [Streptomyces sp. NPDC050516]|uniref:hypothetical protein n=1 Tax=Streptomyces sp. NPDC050516 TaxID=3365621 RepID=UPI0037893052